MSIIPEKTYNEQSSIRTVTNFFRQYRLGSALKSANAYKQKGVPVTVIMKYMVSLIYTGKSMHEDMRSASPLAAGFRKDAVYRLLNAMFINWGAFLITVAARVAADISRLTSDDRLNAILFDDTMFQAAYAKKTELVSLIHDHAEKGKDKFKWGFRMLTMAWTDGTSLVPLAFRHLASSDEKKQRCGVRDGIDKRSRAYRIREEAVTKAPDVMLVMLKSALAAGIAAKHVLFDSWFAYPATIMRIAGLKLHVVARVKDTTKILYLLAGERKTARQIFKESRKRRGRSRYLLSVEIMLRHTEDGKDTTLPARLVYVRNRRKRNEWIAFVCTDMGLGEDEIIALYGKRWDIEVFFKICKSYLRLAKEYRQLSYDALTAGTAVVMLRYMILAVEKRKREDPRSLGEMFFSCYDEVDDIKFEQAIMYIMAVLAEVLNDDDIGLTEEQIGKLMDSFIQKLPSSIIACLKPGSASKT